MTARLDVASLNRAVNLRSGVVFVKYRAGAIGKLVTIDGVDKLPGLRVRRPLQHKRLRLQYNR